MKFFSQLVGLSFLLWCGIAGAQTPNSVQMPPLSAFPSNEQTPACSKCIPKLTPVELVIDTELASNTSKSLDRFPIYLAKPIMLGDQEVIPAGIRGEGEVVHAKKAGGSGTSGELVLAARFLTLGDRSLKLRSMQILIRTSDAVHKVDAMDAAVAGASTFSAAVAPVSLVGFAITGRNILIPKGTLALAKTSEDFGDLGTNQVSSTTTPALDAAQ